MISRAERIAQRVVFLLTDEPLVGVLNVTRDAVWPEDRKQLPVIQVEIGDEAPPSIDAYPMSDRRMDLMLIVLAADPGAAAVADAILIEAHGRITGDADFNGLAFDLNEGATLRRRDALDGKILSITKQYVVHYRTTGFDLT